MRKIFVFVIAILPFIAFAQKSVDVKNVPEKYTRDFQRIYPNATQSKWTEIDSATYEVKFVNNDMKTSVLFRNVSMETRWEVPAKYIPSSIQTYIDANYSKAKIEYAYILDVARNKTYEVGIKAKKEEYLLTFGIEDGSFKEAVKKEIPKTAKKAKTAKKEKKK